MDHFHTKYLNIRIADAMLNTNWRMVVDDHDHATYRNNNIVLVMLKEFVFDL